MLYIPLWESLHVSALNAKVNATTQAPTKVQNMENTNLPKTAHKNWEIQLMFFYTICVWKRQFQVLTSHKQFLMSKYQFYIN